MPSRLWYDQAVSLGVRTSTRCALSASLLICTALFARRAQAGNDETYFLGSDAAITAGAVVASSAGPGSVWYNPAALAHSERSNLSLSLSVASIQVRDYRDAIQVTRADGTIATQTLDGGRIALLSPAVSYVIKLRALTLGAGLFTTRDDVLNVSGASSYTDADRRTSLAQTTLDNALTRYHLGGGAGIALTPKLSLGLSLFGVYEGVDQHMNVALSFMDPSQASPLSAAVSASFRDQSWRAGAQATLGLRYAPLDQLSFGLVLRTPLVMIHEGVEASVLYQIAGQGLDEAGNPSAVVMSTYDPHPRDAAPFGMGAPTRITFGASYRMRRGVISLEGDYSPALRSLEVGADEADVWLVDRRAVFNLRAGTLLRVNRMLELGGGLFTDRATERQVQTLGDTKVDYYGGTLGARISKFLAPAQQGTSTGLVFHTTLAVRYAAGTGSAGALKYEMSADVPAMIGDGDAAHVVFHELHAYLGSGVDY